MVWQTNDKANKETDRQTGRQTIQLYKTRKDNAELINIQRTVPLVRRTGNEVLYIPAQESEKSQERCVVRGLEGLVSRKNGFRLFMPSATAHRPTVVIFTVATTYI